MSDRPLWSGDLVQFSRSSAGWVQTELGGEGAPLSVDDSVRGVVTTIESHTGAPGLQFRDYQNEVIPW